VIVETMIGQHIGGKLVDVNSKSVALQLPDGSSAMIDRANIRAVGAAGDQAIPSYYPSPQVVPGGPQAPVLRWNEGDAIPAGYHWGTERRADLIIGGSVTFGAAWVPTAGLAVFGGPLMAIPVAGPLFASPVEGGRTGGLLVLLVIDSVQQAAGLAMLITGLAMPRKVLRSDSLPEKARWMPVPMTFGTGSVGVGIVGAM
jgi:hypothetical protein